MSIQRDRYDRRILPRWHSSSHLGEIYELISVRQSRQIALPNDDRYLRESRYQFELTPTIGHAADLLSAAIVTTSVEADIDRAAQYLLAHSNKLSPSLLKVVQRYTNDRKQTHDIERMQNIQSAVANSRRLLRINPRDALVWSDLARYYAESSNRQKAIQHMRVALALAPDHRWVLRAAVRCFVHCGDPVLAHRVLAQHPRTKQDPWLIAAELATAQVAKRPPKYWRQANQMLQWGNLQPKHLSELATAVAMYEIENDGHRRARKHLAKGLILPTENTLAQVSWAVQQRHLTGIDNFDTLVERDQNAHEAEFHRQVMAGDYLKALDACARWADDEPFAARPYTGLTYLSSILDDYENTISYAQNVERLDGILDTTTRLNRIYAELSRGETNHAKQMEWFRSELHALIKQGESTHLLANLGLWYYRYDDPKKGRMFYDKSVELSERQGALEQASMASVFCSREAILRREPDAAAQLARASQLAERSRSKAAAFYVRKLTALLASPEKASFILSPASAPKFLEPQTKIVTPTTRIRLVRGESGPVALVSKSVARVAR